METTLNISTGSITFNDDGTVTQVNGSTHPVNSNGFIITQTDPGTPTTNTVTVVGGTHKITLSGVNISVSANQTCAFKLEFSANVTLTLSGDNTLKSGARRAGLQALKGTTLTITGAGSLNTTGGEFGAGIGGGRNRDETYIYGVTGDGNGGDIKILGGTITAMGGYSGAGIGGGDAGDSGTISISGGRVTATGGWHAAGIGGGNNGSGETISISGGTVTAGGGNSGAGIGGGDYVDGAGGSDFPISSGDITISGGMVTATCRSNAAGIGGGHYNRDIDSGNITITGGTVTALCYGWGRAIGASGSSLHIKPITIAPAVGKTMETRVSDTETADWNGVPIHNTTQNPNIFDYKADNTAYDALYSHIREIFTVSGTVYGSDTGSDGLVGASVQLKKGANSIGSAVTTGVGGAYTIPNAPGGTGYTMEVSSSGYDTGTIPSFDVIAAVTGKDITLNKPVAFTALAANGSDTESTTELTLTFDQDIPGLTVDDITVDGATKGALTKVTGQTGKYTLGISGISVADNSMVKVAVSKDGFAFNPANRDVAVRVYTPPGTVATPTFHPGGGTYTTAQRVTLSCATTGATIRYTSDGADPTASSPVYTEPITVAKTTTLKAKAFKDGMTDSATAEATYTIQPTPPTPSTPSSRSGSSMAGGVAYTGNAYAGAWNGGTLTVQADCQKLTSVTVDGVQLRKDSDYTVDCGSTIIAFTPAYLAALKDGTHSVRVQFTDGQYTGNFTTPLTTAVTAITNVPATGDMPMAWAILALAALGLARAAIRRKKA